MYPNNRIAALLFASPVAGCGGGGASSPNPPPVDAVTPPITTDLSGVWAGALHGRRPPPAAVPAAFVTLRGDSLAGATGLSFNGVPQSAFSNDGTKIVARMPIGATSGSVELKFGTKTAASPRGFSADVMAPPGILGSRVLLGFAPAAMAVSPDGRKVYVADRHALSGGVFVLRTAGLATTFHVTS